jgi:hypothetical protein
VIPAVSKGRLELDRLLAPQPEGLLQLEAHTDVVIPDSLERGLVNAGGPRFRRHEAPIRYAVMRVVTSNHILPAHLVRPPSQDAHPVLQRARGQS